MRTDIHNWKPVNVGEIQHIFSNLPVMWWVGGGWALDLHIGRQTRAHHDTDVVVKRSDLYKTLSVLNKNWTIYIAEHGVLKRWEGGADIASVNNIWVAKTENSAWAFQVMVIDHEEKEWFYRREPSIRRPIAEISECTNEGPPYLKPEIQLLYKGGSSNLRAKDHGDFHTILPYLKTEEKTWLGLALSRQFPEGHRWIHNLLGIFPV
ncbi:nucleotidyltransferase domain-containing protein [Salsuginibacillus kocurii]|uniref:nucleotidyltransferase domain-containing protein n=1 Tax=Salsuginibacillus kocurii TaxID=427078 RepID=UPI0003A8D3B0|nr:hypothetical protein [Salsuginibacillus kocurii]